MRTPTPLHFPFTLLAAAAAAVTAAAVGAEERLIPIDEFYLSVPVNDSPGANGKRPGLQVSVRVSRGVQEPLGSTKVEVGCPELSFPERSLAAEEVAVFLEACAAASRGEVFRQEVRRGEAVCHRAPEGDGAAERGKGPGEDGGEEASKVNVKAGRVD